PGVLLAPTWKRNLPIGRFAFVGRSTLRPPNIFGYLSATLLVRTGAPCSRRASLRSSANRSPRHIALLFVDWITASAPCDRVDLVVAELTKARRKEPSNVDYRLRFSHALSADCHAGRGHRRSGGAAAGSSQRRSRGFLPRFAPAGAGGHRSDRPDSVVPTVAHRTGAPAVGGPRGGNSRAGRSPAEDRHAGRPAPSGTAGFRSFPAHLGSLPTRAR